jgi:hypothetical protein
MGKKAAAAEIALGTVLSSGAAASTYLLIEIPKTIEMLPVHALLLAFDGAYMAFAAKMYHNAYKELTDRPDKNNEHASHI